MEKSCPQITSHCSVLFSFILKLLKDAREKYVVKSHVHLFFIKLLLVVYSQPESVFFHLRSICEGMQYRWHLGLTKSFQHPLNFA